MLARIAHELFWLGRNVARAEHTARMLDGVFQADLQGRPDDPGRRAPGLGLAAARSWAPTRRRRPVRPRRACCARSRSTATSPASRRSPASARAREGARTVRDVISAEMWEAINTTHLTLLRRRPRAAACGRAPTRSTSYVKERSALFWGLTAPHDAARRGLARSSRPAGASSPPTWSCACCASRCRRRRGDDEPRRDGQALALLQAVGGFQAFRRAVPGAAERAARSRASCSTSAPTRTRSPRRSTRVHDALERRRRATRATPSRCCASAASAPTSSSAAAPTARTATWRDAASSVQAELALVDARHRRALLRRRRRRRPHRRRRMNFAIRYLTEYRYDGAGHRQPQRAARAAGDDVDASAATSSTCASTPRRASSRHVDYFGTEVLEFGVAEPHDHLTIDVRARVVTSEPPEPPEAPLGRARRPTPTREAAGEFLLPAGDEPETRRARRARRPSRARHAAGDRAPRSAS